MTVRLSEYGMTASMSRKGNCWDNAPSESFFNSLKNERVHGTTYVTRADAQADLFEYIEAKITRMNLRDGLSIADTPKTSCRSR
jgi:putative transposase